MSKFIFRSEQMHLLYKGIESPLSLIVAPAGSGKSVLLDQWLDDISHHDRQRWQVLRVDLSQQHNTQFGLFKALLNHLKDIVPVWEEAAYFHFFKSESDKEPDKLLQVLVQIFSHLSSHLLIVFDDFHYITDAKTHSLISELIHQLPENIRLIISSRTYPPISLSQLKLNEKVFIIDGNDLKLVAREINTLNQQLNGHRLTEAQISALLVQTEGWFVGVKLALLAYAQSGEVALETFNGSQPDLVNYFAHEVLKTMPVDMRHFVLTSSLFDQFDADICESVIDLENGTAILHSVVSHELFVIPVPGLEGVYRYHPLLQDFLQKQLVIEFGKDKICNIHKQAAGYLLSKQRYEKAIRHAAKSKDTELLFRTLRTATDFWLRLGEFDLVIDQLNHVDETEVQQRTDILVIMCYALVFTRRFNQARYYLDFLKSKCQEYNDQHNIDASTQLRIDDFIEYLLLLFQNEDVAFSDNQIGLLALNHKDPEIRALSTVVIAYKHMFKGELVQAFKMANKAKVMVSRTGQKFVESYADMLIVLCDKYMGRAEESARYMSKVYSEAHCSPKSPVWVNLTTGMMVVLYERNDLDQALNYCEKLLPSLNFTCATEVVANVYLYLSKLSFLKGDKRKSAKLLQQLERILQLGDYNRYQSQITQESMRYLLSDGKINVANTLYKKRHLSDYEASNLFESKNYYEENTERNALAAVYFAIAKGRLALAEDILHRLVDWLDRLDIASRTLVAKCNLAIVTTKRGHKDKSIFMLAKLIEQYGITCFSRSVFDEVPGLSSLFREAMHENKLSLPDNYLTHFSKLLLPDSVHFGDIAPLKGLTEKELEVFTLLSKGLSNNDISKKAGVALSTTKWHLKNIYSKLGIASRSEAITLSHKLTVDALSD